MEEGKRSGALCERARTIEDAGGVTQLVLSVTHLGVHQECGGCSALMDGVVEGRWGGAEASPPGAQDNVRAQGPRA